MYSETVQTPASAGVKSAVWSYAAYIRIIDICLKPEYEVKTPTDKCVDAVNELLKEHPDSVATYRPERGGLVLVVNDPILEDAVVTFVRAINEVEASIHKSVTGSLLGGMPKIPEA